MSDPRMEAMIALHQAAIRVVEAWRHDVGPDTGYDSLPTTHPSLFFAIVELDDLIASPFFENRAHVSGVQPDKDPGPIPAEPR